MQKVDDMPRSHSRRTFLRILGLVWLTSMGLILGGALLAPHLASIADAVLHQTVHRQWMRLRVTSEPSVFDLSTPARTLQSYYSALYHGDVLRMTQLTDGALREQMHQRVSTTTTAPAFTPYQSFLRTEQHGEHEVVMLEKLHLFWSNGLRFLLQREANQWRIVSVMPVP